MSDRRLDQLFRHFQRKGDLGALAGVFDLAAPELLRVARHLTADETLAEDALQSTFLTAIEKRAEYDPRARVLPWLLGILVRRVRQGHAQAARRPDPERLAPRAADDPAHVVAGREVHDLVERGVAALPATYVAALRAYLLHGKSAPEIARHLGISANAASVRIHRGLDLLRRHLPRGAAIGTAAAAAYALPAGTSSAALAGIRGQVLAQAAATVPGLATTSLASLGGALTLGGLTMSKLSLLSAVAVLCLATALGFAHRSRVAERQRLEAQIARLEQRLDAAQVGGDGPAAGNASRAGAAASPRVALQPSASPGPAPEPAPVASAPELDPAAWLRRFEAAADFRAAWDIAEELAELDEADSLAILRAIFHDIPGPSHRVQVLKPFVFGGGLGNAVEVLHLAATDPDAQVREAAFTHLRNYAFRDFGGDLEAYADWYARYGGLPLSEVLRGNARELVATLNGSTPEALVALLGSLTRIDRRTGSKQGLDVLALLEEAGLQTTLAREIHPAGDPQAMKLALRWLGDLDADESLLRSTALPVIERAELYPPEVLGAAYRTLGREGQAWAVQPILQSMLRKPPGTGTYFAAAGALGEIGDPTVIPTLIAMIVAEDGYETCYGVGYFGLRKLTGVDYDESHGGAFWLEWWARNRQHLAPEVQGLEIPTVVLPPAR